MAFLSNQTLDGSAALNMCSRGGTCYEVAPVVKNTFCINAVNHSITLNWQTALKLFKPVKKQIERWITGV